MSAPVAVVRQEPTAPRLENGFISRFAFSQDPDIDIYEITVQPPGVDGGDPINIGTQWDEGYEIFAPRAKKTLTSGQITCAYNPVALQQLQDIVNVRGTLTQIWPDEATLAFFGYVKSAEPDALEDGTFPTMTVTYQPTNYDPVNKVVEGPVFTAGSGT